MWEKNTNLKLDSKLEFSRVLKKNKYMRIPGKPSQTLSVIRGEVSVSMNLTFRGLKSIPDAH